MVTFAKVCAPLTVILTIYACCALIPRELGDYRTHAFEAQHGAIWRKERPRGTVRQSYASHSDAVVSAKKILWKLLLNKPDWT